MKIIDLNILNVINALPDIVYIIGRDHKIKFTNQSNWSKFAIENKAPELAIPSKVIDKNIFDFIQGDDTKEFYQSILENIVHRKVNNYQFPFRCDSPRHIRNMRMYISPIYNEDIVQYFLFHSLLITEIERPEVKIFNKKKYGKNKIRELVFVCSYCKNIHYRKNGEEKWITAEEYKLIGGNDDVTIAHKICPSCDVSIIKPLIKHSKILINTI